MSKLPKPESIKNKDDFLGFLQDENDKSNQLEFKINKDISGKLIMNAGRRNNFLQHINILSIGIPSIAYLTDTTLNINYFVTSIIFFMMSILFTLLSFRESFDNEEANLIKLRDQYNNIIDNKRLLIDKYSKEDFSCNLFNNYIGACQNMPDSQIIEDDIKEEKEKRQNRKNEPLSYLSEMVIFLFCLGILFLIISVFNIMINWFLISFVILLVFSLSFQDIFNKIIIVPISHIMALSNKTIRFKK